MLRFLIILICFFNVITNVNAETAQSECNQHHCVAIVDAGSSGSRLHVYAFDLDTSNNAINIKEVWSKKIKPGFSTIEPAQATINAYLNNLVANAPTQNMPLYFYATAGMRLLSQPKQQQYYLALQEWFAGQTQFQLISAKTITGSEEGLFDWLAVNYRVGGLISNDKPLVGVMDIGGASVQIAFPVQDMTSIDSKDIITVTIYGRSYNLFVHSFLGLGQNEMSHQYLDTPSCFPDGYQMPNGYSAEGDASTCQSLVTKLVNDVQGVEDIVKPAITTNPVSSWYAMGGVAMLVTDPPFNYKNNSFTNKSLLNKANIQVCQQQWKDLYNLYPNNENLYGDCLLPSYYYALMVNGYGLEPKGKVNFLENPQNTDWTLGVVLYQ